MDEEDATSPRTAGSDSTSETSTKRQSHHHRTFTPVSSFLSGRNMDPDGYPIRKVNFWGQSPQKSLAELVGNEYLFAELHAEFVALLQTLGRAFGGVPVDESSNVENGGVDAGGEARMRGGETGERDDEKKEEHEEILSVHATAGEINPSALHSSHAHNHLPSKTAPTATYTYLQPQHLAPHPQELTA